MIVNLASEAAEPEPSTLDALEPEPVTLDALDAEIWPLVFAYLDLTAYVSLPQTNAALRAAFDTPRLRIACVKALLGGAARSPLAWAATARLGVAEQIAAKSRILVLRRHVRSLARAAVTRRSDEVFALCVRSSTMTTCTRTAAACSIVRGGRLLATALLLRHPDTVLPTVATSIKLQMDDSGAVVGDARRGSGTRSSRSRARGRSPFSTRSSSASSTTRSRPRAAIETLNSLDAVAFRVPAAGCRAKDRR